MAKRYFVYKKGRVPVIYNGPTKRRAELNEDMETDDLELALGWAKDLTIMNPVGFSVWDTTLKQEVR